MIKVKQKGNFKKTKRYFNRLLEIVRLSNLDQYGRRGVDALQAATPQRTGKTANSWRYEIIHEPDSDRIVWVNDNVTDRGLTVAILIQYGHGTRGGTYVQGIDFINPAMKPIFDDISEDIRKELSKA